MRSALLGLCLLPMLAQAAVYKCVGNDGAVSYSAVPCPATEGQTTRIVEPMPTSGPPAAVPPLETQASPAATASEPDRPPGTRITVIEDSSASNREARANEMRERAQREKEESYIRDFERIKRQEQELRLQREYEVRQRQQSPAPSPNSSSSTTGEPSSTGTGQ